MAQRSLFLVVARVAMSLLFVVSGEQKVLAPARMAPLFVSLGLPGWSEVAVGLFELFAGIAFAVGYQTRWVAIALGHWCIGTALAGHRFWDDPSQLPDFLKNVGLAGAFMAAAFLTRPTPSASGDAAGIR